MNLAKVNYLDLLNNTNLRKEAESCIQIYGVGSCGPRGFYGTIGKILLLFRVRIVDTNFEIKTNCKSILMMF